MSDFNAGEYKLQQERTWNALAPSWARWEGVFEAGARGLNGRLIELAGLQPSSRVLDLGTGLGEPALSAAVAVRAGGRVVAVDQSADMLAFARDRAARAGLSEVVEFVRADADSLDIEDAFDAVLSRWGLMFLPNVAGVVTHAFRSLSPGGRLVAAVWSAPADVPIIGLAFGVISRMLSLPPPVPGTPSPFALSDRSALVHLMRSAGFEGVETEQHDLPFRFDSTDQFNAYSADLLPPFFKAKVDALEPNARADVWREVARVASQYAQPNGSLLLTSRAILIVGSRPARSQT